jgi:hypothetical protein
MYSVFIPTPVTAGIMEPGQLPDPSTRCMIHTRKGRTYKSIYAARALAKRHLGQVRQFATNRVIEDFFV